MFTAHGILAPLTTLFRDHSLVLIASVALLGASATFSGCETALFSLAPPELNRIRSGSGRIDRMLAELLADLKRLLPSLLFCNMMVNVLIFALSAVVGASLRTKYGTAGALCHGLFSLGAVIFGGEVFPKQVAIAARVPVARITAVPVWLLHRLLARPMSILNTLVAMCERAADAGGRNQTELREEELRLLMDLSKIDGVINNDEYELIDGIVDLPEVKIRDIMTPRVDTAMIRRDTTAEDALEFARISGHTKLPVLDVAADDLSGWVDVRDIFLADARGALGKFVRRLQFFSEHDRADQVLTRLKKGDDGLMAVVDERGSFVGVFTMQDIMDEVLGHFGDYGSAPPEQIRESGGGYVVAGGVSVREWRSLFGVSEAIPHSATVGGLVTALLGRPARRGDRVAIGNVEMTVLRVWRNRVIEVAVRLVLRHV